MRRDPAPAVTSVAAVGLGGAIIFSSARFGSVANYMAGNIALMSLAAPLLALALHTSCRAPPRLKLSWTATGVQLMLLLVLHLPSSHAAMDSGAAAVLAAGALTVAATTFWFLLLTASAHAPWHAVMQLMITGKIACLLGAILVFAPRLLYPGHEGHASMSALEDQQLAGLLMIAACPLSYVSAGLVIATRTILSRPEADASPAAIADEALTAR